MTDNIITMTNKEAQRYDVIKDLINKKIDGTQASIKLNLSIRQTKRIKKEVIKHGIKGIIHKNRGRESNNKISDKLKNKIVNLRKEIYHDFSITLFQEKLIEIHNLEIKYTSLKNILIQKKLYTPRKRKKNKQYHAQRPRKEYYGELQQYDGSYHDWFEGRCTDKGFEEEQCLLVAIDDATSKLTHVKLAKNESTHESFLFWDEYIQKNEKPVNIYTDRFSTYKINHKNATDNKEFKTQFHRAMTELGINVIFANSPEAKGRVENVNGTLQDRLIKELRLANINNIKDANEFIQKVFIPAFNKKFAVIPKQQGDIHNKLIENTKHILCIKKQRIVRNDFIIQYKNRYFQLDEIQPTTIYKKDKLIVEDHESEIYITKNNKYLNFKELHEKPIKEISLKLPAITTHKSNYKPPSNHPWRMYEITNQQKVK